MKIGLVIFVTAISFLVAHYQRSKLFGGFHSVISMIPNIAFLFAMYMGFSNMVWWHTLVIAALSSAIGGTLLIAPLMRKSLETSYVFSIAYGVIGVLLSASLLAVA